MSSVLDTTDIPARDREEMIRHAVWESLVRIDIDHHLPPEELTAHIGLDTAGPLGICSARATSMTIRRTPRLAREDEEPAVFLGLQVTGTSLVAQNGRQALLRPGDFALYDTVTPYTLLFGEGVDHHFLRFPRAALALPERALRDITAVALGPGNPLAGLASTYFSQLVVSEELHSGPYAEAVAEPSIELVRAVVASQLGSQDLARAPLEATLSLRITRYMRAHLAERDLSAARIAAAHDISVRHLYTVLARSGIALGDWIRSHRLAECKRELAGPEGRARTIAAVGRSWGFVDATHFSKVFKQAYGISPRAWRDANHPAPRRERRG
ncbi:MULTISPECIES: helix-turn-helix domain-containing protein [unclassified Streptomyces]|uniref:AraC-like ligand-binding domain-containing protein n=1 Tax=unclassified Streptomyces TaxID=2593676 RepID=UPI00093F9B01|nr:helix-turn-helix domain-containing protein [Streptomyces sp. CB02058]OKI95749.1 AraC family transcriptional regulator [Streptomyces sp. CB02058]